MSSLMQLVYRAQKRMWKLVRSRTRGVKVMLFNEEGEILLIRNSYERASCTFFPGAECTHGNSRLLRQSARLGGSLAASSSA
jgi:hypothetical protein